MRFYTKELWAEINLASRELRRKAEAKWEENDRAYMNYLKLNMDKGVQQYLDLMECYHGFHDYVVTAIHFNPETKEGSIDLLGTQKNISILFKSVESISANLQHITLYTPKMEWGYHEVFFAGNSIELAICFDYFSEMCIMAKDFFLRDEKGEIHPWFG